MVNHCFFNSIHVFLYQTFFRSKYPIFITSTRFCKCNARYLTNVFKICCILGFTFYTIYFLNRVSRYFNVNYRINCNPIHIYTEDIVDNTNTKNDFLRDVQSLPEIAFLRNSTCGRYPDFFNIEFNQIYWQTLRTSNGIFQVFGAYLDTRKENKLGRTVRILGMIDRLDPNVTTYCQFWFEGENDPVIEEVHEVRLIWQKRWGGIEGTPYLPYLISCVLPSENNKTPISISVVENKCDNAANNLRVIYNQAEEKKDFAICVKGLDFLYEDISIRLAEWIELSHLLGADKIYFYDLSVHPNISKVLKYYEEQNKVHVTPLTLAGSQPNTPTFQHLYLQYFSTSKRLNELIPYNDCFYKHMYQYKYIVLMDIDEIIMPLEDTWKKLLNNIKTSLSKITNQMASAFCVRHVYFLDNFLHRHIWFAGIPKYMHILQHVFRTKNFTADGQFVKCFHNTEKVLTIHNHFPLSCLGNKCTFFSINTQDAQLQHYRHECVKYMKETCKKLTKDVVADTTVWKFKNLLIPLVRNTLTNLGLI